ncbi:long-chain-fatty-acid--CoA ligase [Caballeronia sp. LjRoot34]|uniref:long-chain-fatty-acid--CoA ligase n=1 Tax=Caballeronia sp. LjRoot34 TaxID=3342325 RepID=UPI003ECD226A
MERTWLKAYPPGVPADIDPARYRSLPDLLDESFEAFASRQAFACMGRTLTYAELDVQSRNLGAWLQSKGLARGARVAIMMPNVLQYPVAMAAILRAGYVIVNVNPLYTPRELEHQLADSGAEAIVLLEPFDAVLQAVQRNTRVLHVVVTSIGEMMGVSMAASDSLTSDGQAPTPRTGFWDALAQGARSPFARADLKPDDLAVLQYTGGTTGVSKGAMLLHRNLIANVLQSEAWREPLTRDRPNADPIVTVVALPLYHIFGLTVCAFLTMRAGGLGILIPNPRDIPAMIKALQGYAINSFPAVNTLYNALLNDPGFATLDLSRLLLANGGGMAIQHGVAARWFERTGKPIIEGYGLSETSPCATSNPSNGTAFSGSVGVPLPSTFIVIRDDDGRDVANGEPGEICIFGPQVMAGYWNRPDETASVMTPDGYFKSGDIGIMDERGFVRIVDRKKDMVIVSGFNVYPNEIEDVVASHPGVFEVAAIGVRDEHSGEAVKLFVVRRDPDLSEGDILAFCRERLTGYKRPKAVEFCDDLPKSNVGKILRRKLRDREG